MGFEQADPPDSGHDWWGSAPFIHHHAYSVKSVKRRYRDDSELRRTWPDDTAATRTFKLAFIVLYVPGVDAKETVNVAVEFPLM